MPFVDVTPAEAFRMLLRVWRPGPLAEEIESYKWFRAYYRYHRPRSAAEVDDAKKALDLLRRTVQSGTVRLRGILYKRVKGILETQGPPAGIDLADQRLGDLDVFNAKLIIYETGWQIAHEYRHVFCNKTDVDKLFKSVTREVAATGGISKQKVPPAVIRKAISDVYDAAEKGATKPPNILELPATVQPLLDALGYRASGRQIKDIGKEEEFADRRGKVGSGKPRQPKAVSK
jgi:hypothetical protein